MTHSLENETLSVKINAVGAELISLITKKNNLEYIWQAHPEAWARHAPVLFPFVGKLKGDSFSYQGKNYHMSQHGFARDKEFHPVKHGEASISLQLNSDEDSLKIYPFPFELTTTYTLDGNKLSVHHQIYNPEASAMYFSIGAHPAFRCPLLGEGFDDYYLEFESEEKLVRHKIKEGLLSGEKETVKNDSNVIHLQKELFKEDALVFKELKSKFVTLKNKANDHQVKVSLEGFPYLGIWTKMVKTADFLCIEPWLGLADHVNHEGDIVKKEGINKLVSYKRFDCSYYIDVR
ncbi:MAG: aldose 1-epimerase family protein [Bacteroidota bacterium]|nr:aldose 1-epimerase family protein [Bacteroidota bacterium]